MRAHVRRLAPTVWWTVALLVVIGVQVAFAQDPITRMSGKVRESFIQAGQDFGLVSFVIGLVGLIGPGHDKPSWLMWAFVGGGGLFSVTTVVSYFWR